MKQFVTKILLAVLLLSVIPFQSVSAASGQDIVNSAKSHIGVRYVFGGTTPSGFDCSGFLRYVYGQAGINLPRISADQYHAGRKITKAELKPGDLVFFHSTYKKSGITHAGIYVGNNEFISATTSKGIKIDSLSSAYWGPKYYGATRVIEEKPVVKPEVKPELQPGDFYDVPANNPAYLAISSLSKQGIVNGFSNGTFEPDANVTRGQAAAIISRVINKNPASLNSFPDVASNHAFAREIALMKELGIIQGFQDGTFRPDSNMNKAEMAVIVQKAFNLQNGNFSVAGQTYNDINPSHWAYDAIVTMNSIDTTSLFAGNNYNADAQATRSFFATAIYNAMNAK